MRTILIQNFHVGNTVALVRDFKSLGYRVLMPNNDWGGLIGYFFSNENLEGELIGRKEFEVLPPGDVLIGCYEQMNDFAAIARNHGDRIILHTAGNNVPYYAGLSNHLISPDIQTFNNYTADHKMMYFYPPTIVTDYKKDLRESFKSNIVCTYNHFYNKYWPEAFAEAVRFETLFGGKVFFYGEQTRDGKLEMKIAQETMARSKFTLYFKPKDCYGNAVLESMVLGTPVIAMSKYIEDKTLGMFFINSNNSIIVNSPEEAIERVNRLTFQEYEALSNAGKAKVATMTADKFRLSQMKEVLEL